MAGGRTIQLLVGTHMIVFVAGFAAGKWIDYDELQNYRSSHETTSTRIKRHAGQLGISVLVIGTVAVIVKVGSALSSRISAAAK